MKKTLKIILRGLLVIIIVAIIFILINFIVHKIKTQDEYNELNKLGYIDKYSAGDYNLNIYRIGNRESKHKLIAISGLGINDYSVGMSFVNDKLMSDYEIIYIDRAGYGYSDDTSKKQTTDQIVSDYRTALENAGITGPYILLPHSLGGVYATYWESTYPDEIEGVIFIDTTEIGLNVWNEEDYNVGIIDYLELFACELGLQRFVLNNYYYPLPSYYSEEDQKISDYLNTYSILNSAKISETREMNNNTNKAYESIKSNDIPKIYINANAGFRNAYEVKEYFKWMNERAKELGVEEIQIPSDDAIDNLLLDYIKWTNERINPYIESLGNTKLILLPGDHLIFQQKPDELAKIIKDFIISLD